MVTPCTRGPSRPDCRPAGREGPPLRLAQPLRQVEKGWGRPWLVCRQIWDLQTGKGSRQGRS